MKKTVFAFSLVSAVKPI